MLENSIGSLWKDQGKKAKKYYLIQIISSPTVVMLSV